MQHLCAHTSAFALSGFSLCSQSSDPVTTYTACVLTLGTAAITVMDGTTVPDEADAVFTKAGREQVYQPKLLLLISVQMQCAKSATFLLETNACKHHGNTSCPCMQTVTMDLFTCRPLPPTVISIHPHRDFISVDPTRDVNQHRFDSQGG